MTHFQYMQQQGQITIFDFMAEPQFLQGLKVGDHVKCTVTVEQDAEAYYFLKYYHPEALREIGEVVKVEGKAVTLRFRSEYVMVSAEYLVHQ